MNSSTNSLPYMDFMNQQVKVGLKVEEEDEKGQPIMVKDKKTDKDTPKTVVKMNPRLNKFVLYLSNYYI